MHGNENKAEEVRRRHETPKSVIYLLRNYTPITSESKNSSSFEKRFTKSFLLIGLYIVDSHCRWRSVNSLIVLFSAPVELTYYVTETKSLRNGLVLQPIIT